MYPEFVCFPGVSQFTRVVSFGSYHGKACLRAYTDSKGTGHPAHLIRTSMSAFCTPQPLYNTIAGTLSESC